MRDKDALPFDHCPFDRVAGTPLDALVEPPHHLVFFLPGTSATLLTVVLFGEIAFRVTGLPSPSIAWHLDPNRPRVHGETTWDSLKQGMIRRRFPTSFDDD